MKNLYIVMILLVTMFSTGCISTNYEKRVLNDNEWIEDINFLDSKLREYHSDLFKFVGEDTWNKNINKLKEDVPKLSDSSIKLRIVQIISSIGDAHTSVLSGEIFAPIPSTMPKRKNITEVDGILEFPIKCDYFDDGLRVIECDTNYEQVLGYKLISINNKNIDTIVSDISTLVSYDYGNEQKGKAHASRFLNVYEILKFLNIVLRDEAEYIFENHNNEKIKLSIKAKNNEKIKYISANKKKMKTNVVPKGSTKFYWYNNFKEDNILFFKFNKFITDISSENYPNFHEFLDGLIEEINSNNYKRFVIDLRENNGGLIEVLNAFIENITYRTNLEGKNIYILTSKKSASASVLLAFHMQSKKGANIVGETTGGNVNSFNTVNYQIELPNSKLKPVISLKLQIKEEEYKGGVKPDIEVKQKYKDYIDGIDTCYEYIKQL